MRKTEIDLLFENGLKRVICRSTAWHSSPCAIATIQMVGIAK